MCVENARCGLGFWRFSSSAVCGGGAGNLVCCVAGQGNLSKKVPSTQITAAEHHALKSGFGLILCMSELMHNCQIVSNVETLTAI